MLMSVFESFTPTQIIFGEGKINTLPEILPENAKNVLIVTGKSSSKANKILQTTQSIISPLNKKVFVFDKIEPNPLTITVDTGAQFAKLNSIDIVLGIGGGSPMDAAKCIALVANNNIPMKNFLKGALPEKPAIPTITIPTTAGTGSEVNHSGVISDENTKSKSGFTSEYIFPKAAILDPTFTITMPQDITVDTGIDALTHAIEGYLSTRAVIESDKLALETIIIIKDTLPKVVENRRDIALRTQMLYASMLGGLIIAKAGTIMLHAMGYPLTTFYNIPHGRANGILLPDVLEFLKTSQPQKIQTINSIFNGKIEKFLNKLGISTKLKDYNIKDTDIPRFLDNVWGRRNLLTTPQSVSKQDIINLYSESL